MGYYYKFTSTTMLCAGKSYSRFNLARSKGTYINGVGCDYSVSAKGTVFRFDKNKVMEIIANDKGGHPPLSLPLHLLSISPISYFATLATHLTKGNVRL